MKKIFYLLIIGLFFAFPALAADYPIIMGIDINSPDVTISQYIVYLFYLLVSFGTLAVVILISIAGLEWVSSGGDPSIINSAKKKIRNSIVGLTVLFTSYLVIQIINPSLLNIEAEVSTIESEKPEIFIPENGGINLYSSVLVDNETLHLSLQESSPSLIVDNFYKKTESIKIVNIAEFGFGAILFADKEQDGKLIPGAEFKGNCVYILGDIPDLDNPNLGENNPPIGKNNLASVIVFKTPTSGAIGGSVTLYNNFNCQLRSNKYCRDDDCMKEEEQMCVINGENGFKDLEESCPDFKGDIVSIKTDNKVGILFKDNTKDEEGRCQFFESNTTGCINTIKYGSMYYLEDNSLNSIISPKSFMIFNLYK